MKILVLNPILYTPNNNVIPKVKSIKDTMIYNMCLGFKKLGNEVVLAAAEDFEPTEKESYDFEVVFLKTEYKKVFLPSVLPFSWQLRTYLKEKGNCFDLIISSEAFSFFSFFATRICPMQTVIWHELALHQRKFHKMPSKIWYNIVVRFLMRSPLFVCRSLSARDFVKKYHLLTSNECVEHGINISKFCAVKDKENAFVVVSQLIKRKNLPSIILKFRDLVEIDKYKDFKLYIIGQGEQKEELVNLTKKLNLQENTCFLGFLSHEQMQKYVGKSKALLIDTLQDNNMVSIPEAIACGTPVLTNWVPTNSYIIKENGLGIVKDQWRVDELKEIVDKNSDYVSNCIHYRDKLANTYSAQSLINIFLQQQKC